MSVPATYLVTPPQAHRKALSPSTFNGAGIRNAVLFLFTEGCASRRFSCSANGQEPANGSGNKEEMMVSTNIRTGSRGALSASHLFSLRDLGLRTPGLHLDRMISIFLSIGEAVAARWIQMPKAILLLQMAPDNPSSGAIYFYDRRSEEFYMVGFEREDDNLTADEFSDLLREYDLLRYAENPELLYSLPANVGAA